MNNRTYVILDASEVGNVDFNQVIQVSADKLRYSLDGSKFVLKYEDGQPSFLWGKTEYTDSEILEVLATDEWNSDEPI
jgi:hypothetical protein